MVNAIVRSEDGGIPATSAHLPDILVGEPFRGITSDGKLVPGLFPLGRTGVSARPIRDAAEKFLAALNPHQRRKIVQPLDSDEWRWWNNTSLNQHRSGLCFMEMNGAIKELALGIVNATLSEHGFATARDIMRLNETVAELTGEWFQYGEYVYWLTIFGTPAEDQPWGWQMDGHHCILNCLIVGDQVVLSPIFVGTEPVHATTGKYAGVRTFEREEQDGIAVMQALDAAQRDKATISNLLPREVFAGAYRDNYTLGYEGVRYADLGANGQSALLRLIETWTGYLRPGHAQVRLDEVQKHLGDTRFAWAGQQDGAEPFYYRIHSPVFLVEFDFLPVIAFTRNMSVYPPALETRGDCVYLTRPGDAEIRENRHPYKQHIHAIMRTPNGNDYGQDLLRQHYARFDHAFAAQKAT